MRKTRSALVLALLACTAACGGDSGTEPPVDGDPTQGTPPTAPAALAARALGGSAIELTWQDNSSNETGFRIERSPDGTSGWSQVGATAADAVAYEDAGLAEGTTAYYRVAAEGSAGVSAFSNVAEATTPAGIAAGAIAIERAIERVLPPPGTPLAQRNLQDEVHAVAEAARDIAGVDSVFVLERELTTQIVMDDGVVHLFINNRPYGIESLASTPFPAAPRATKPPAPSPAVRNTPAASDGPPGSARAVVTSFDGGAGLASEIASMLTGVGYNVLGLGASLDDMRQYTNLGVLHLDTHGVAFTKVSDGAGAAGFTSFALQTSTRLGSDLTHLREELLDGSLAISTDVDAAGRVRTSIAITEVFIARYWSFDDGVVMLHACFGGSGPFLSGLASGESGGTTVDPSILRLAMLGAGARAVIAFDNLTWDTYARPSIMHFFDRMLGANTHDTEDPPLRPFDIEEIYADMQDRGLLRFTRPSYAIFGLGIGGNDVNVVFDRVPGRATLAPSIKTMTVVDDAAESDGELTLEGLFGDQEGTVEVEGAAIPVESWSNESIVARVPFLGTGSAGPVVVKRPTGVKSNEAPLTEWRGTIKVTFATVGTLTATAELDVRFRADVHRSRNRLTDDPEHRVVPAYFSPSSSGTVRGSGSHTANNVTVNWTGARDMPLLEKQYIDNGFFPLLSSAMGGVVTLDPDGEEAELCLGVLGIITQQSPAGASPLPVIHVSPELFDRMHGLFGCVDVDLDDDSFEIGDGRRTHSNEGLDMTLEWSTFVPFAAPTENTAG